IYSRKSKTTDKGESITNQIETCKDYISRWSNINTSDIEFIIYKDEGFSGGNTDRPEFQRLLSDARKGKFNMLVCYRLDRVSRNIADFSNTYELLQEHNIEFVSVKEQFDTSTPIGRAMLNIAMVFAQLERETIAERVRDNMLGLARTGRWLGGTTPTGFISEPIDYLDHNLNSKKMYRLTIDSFEFEKIKLIFSKFMEIKSLRGTESYLLIHDIFSKNDCTYTAATLKDLLKNPVYAAADKYIYSYLDSLGCEICNKEDEFDGTHGLMVYNKTNQSGKSISVNNPSNWIVAIGHHEPAISGDIWVMIQQLLDANTSKSFYTKETMQYGILTNLIKCKHCGSNMKIKKGKVSSSGELAYTYVCSTKEMSRRTKCDVKNIIGQEADQDVLDYLLSLANDESFILSTLTANQLTINKDIKDTSSKLKELESTLLENEQAIDNLMSQLAKLSPEHAALSDRFINQLQLLDATNISIKSEIKNSKAQSTSEHSTSLNLDLVRKSLLGLNSLSDTDDIQIRRALVRTVVNQITWDGETLRVELFGQDKVTPTHLCSDSECYTDCRGGYPICYAK
ncbi:MAG: recombinase family protein, partial [Cellulosilyticaceae bacterium]